MAKKKNDLSQVIEDILGIITKDVECIATAQEADGSVSPDKAKQLTDYLKVLSAIKRDVKKEEKEATADFSQLDDDALQKLLDEDD